MTLMLFWLWTNVHLSMLEYLSQSSVMGLKVKWHWNTSFYACIVTFGILAIKYGGPVVL